MNSSKLNEFSDGVGSHIAVLKRPRSGQVR